MVLRLKTRESRSLPGTQNSETCSASTNVGSIARQSLFRCSDEKPRVATRGAFCCLFFRSPTTDVDTGFFLMWLLLCAAGTFGIIVWRPVGKLAENRHCPARLRRWAECLCVCSREPAGSYDRNWVTESERGSVSWRLSRPAINSRGAIRLCRTLQSSRCANQRQSMIR